MGFLFGKHRQRNVIIFGVLLLIIALSVLIVGINKYTKTETCKEPTAAKDYIKFLTKVKEKYYKHYPQELYMNPDTNVNEYVDNFNPLNTKPLEIKKRTDKSLELLKEFKNLELDKALLKPRERKSIAQLEHFLSNNLGHPYDENYYAGDWMMGPNYFCWQSICSIGSSIKDHFNKKNGFKPRTSKDVEKIIDILKQVKDPVIQYQKNLYLGVKAGMIRSSEECLAGLNVFKNKYQKIAFEGANGVTNESFAKDLTDNNYYNLTKLESLQFESKYKTTAAKIVSEILIDYVGKPIKSLIEYLSTNHSRYCVPSDIASGLSNLPLKYIWLDQNKTNVKTTQRLPTGEKLDGRKSYEMILPYFTTSKDYTYEKIKEVGIRQRDILYKKAKKLAIKITGIPNEKQAIEKFVRDLDSSGMFFNTSVIPDSENDEEGGRRCPNMEKAKSNCPIRYAAMQDWFKSVREALSLIEPKISHLFYMTGTKQTTPSCPLQITAKFNPSSGSQSYSGSDAECTHASTYYLPFFLKRPGPKYGVLSVAGHEGRPGHHTQVQGFTEHFQSTSKVKDVIDWLNYNSYYTAFTEGWALYAENPLLSENTDLYADNPLQEYGMLKWQLWRALRLIIDTGLHSRGMTLDEALQMFKEFCWDTTDKSYKDTIRYMSGPGQATAYMIGQLAIWDMRKKVKTKFMEAKIDFNEKEFHYHVLSQGSSPLHYLKEHIDNYIACKINPTSQKYCKEILDPSLSANSGKYESIGSEERWRVIFENYNRMEHFD